MLEKLFKLLSDAKSESDNEKKISLFEEYSENLEKFLSDSNNIKKVNKQIREDHCDQ